jgi:hypothetical protein
MPLSKHPEPANSECNFSRKLMQTAEAKLLKIDSPDTLIDIGL